MTHNTMHNKEFSFTVKMDIPQITQLSEVNFDFLHNGMIAINRLHNSNHKIVFTNLQLIKDNFDQKKECIEKVLNEAKTVKQNQAVLDLLNLCQMQYDELNKLFSDSLDLEQSNTTLQTQMEACGKKLQEFLLNVRTTINQTPGAEDKPDTEAEAKAQESLKEIQDEWKQYMKKYSDNVVQQVKHNQQLLTYIEKLNNNILQMVGALSGIKGNIDYQKNEYIISLPEFSIPGSMEDMFLNLFMT